VQRTPYIYFQDVPGTREMDTLLKVVNRLMLALLQRKGQKQQQSNKLSQDFKKKILECKGDSLEQCWLRIKKIKSKNVVASAYTLKKGKAESSTENDK
jgi:hypothetical protein